MSDSIPGAASAAPLAWVQNPKVQLRWRQMGDEWLLFEVLSGQTHQIDSATAAVLTCFEGGEALSMATLTMRMVSDYALAPDQGPARAVLESAVTQFLSLGLIIPTTLQAKMHAAH